MKSDELKALGDKHIGKPYIFGVEVSLTDKDPKAFDCSELVQWLYAQIGCKVPDGSQNQFDASEPVTEPKLGDVGFFRKPGASTHHVGLYWSDGQVLEARGDPYNKVILRPQKNWEAWKDFTGWRRFKKV